MAGRKTEDGRNAVSASVNKSAPTSLSSAEKEIWDKIVEPKLASWFSAANCILLKEFCRASAHCDWFSAMLADLQLQLETLSLADEEYAVALLSITKFHGLLTKASAMQTSYATKLRLTPQSQMEPRTAFNAAAAENAGGNAEKPWGEGCALDDVEYVQ